VAHRQLRSLPGDSIIPHIRYGLEFTNLIKKSKYTGEMLRKIRAEKGVGRPPKCIECDKNIADYPSRLCPGCEAYKEHQQ